MYKRQAGNWNASWLAIDGGQVSFLAGRCPIGLEMVLFDLVADYRQAWLRGLVVTGWLCLFGCVGGTLIGGVAAFSLKWAPSWAVRAFDTGALLTQACPAIVLLYWLHYPLQASLGVVIDPFVTTAALLVSLNAVAVGQILRAATSQIPFELLEVARLCDLSARTTFFTVELPLSVRYALGPLVSAQVTVLQTSIFGSFISVQDVFRVAHQINAREYRPIEVYSIVALIFIVVCLPLTLAAQHLSRTHVHRT